jgi:hypothetical protein
MQAQKRPNQAARRREGERRVVVSRARRAERMVAGRKERARARNWRGSRSEASGAGRRSMVAGGLLLPGSWFVGGAV